LVDVLPTLAEVAGADIPNSWPERELTPLAGVSLAPIFAGAELPSRPPIHLLFSTDRGLRDGDWKLVSFRSQPWELYNLAEDRTELRNLAAEHPEIVARMANQWHEMTAHVLQAPAKEQTPVGTTGAEQQHREWSVYTGGASTSSRMGDTAAGRKKAAKTAAGDSSRGAIPRARAGTKLKIQTP
jgi:arylsulfatase